MTPTQGFDLPLAQGAAWLEVPCPSPGEGVAQAQALAAALPALAALESWLAVELPCPKPARAPVVAGAAAARASPASHLSLSFEASTALVGGRLSLPWSALKPGRAAPAGLPVQWPPWPARVCLQVLPSERLTASGLKPGAVLLLPASFQEPWPMQVRALASPRHAAPAGWQVAAAWQPREGRMHLSGGPVQVVGEATAADAWSVWLCMPQTVDLSAWFGGAIDAPLAAWTAELHRSSRVVAQGRLVPCGAGWGLRIEQVENLELAAAWT